MVAPPPVTPVDALIVFVNHHSESMIEPRAARLAHAGFDVVVADNSGTFPEGAVPVVRCRGNVGFGAACNAAVAASAPHRAIVFHNPDVDIAPEAARRLVAEVEARKIGLLAPAESTPQGLRTRGYAYPSLLREVLRPSPADLHRNGSQVNRRRRWTDVGRSSHRFGGGGLLVALAEAFEAVGGFDRRYFLYGEDLDLWHRVKRAGYPVTFTSRITYRHESHTGSPVSTGRREMLRWLSIELFAETHEGHVAWRLLRRIHQRRLPALAGDWPAGVAAVEQCWRSGRRPHEVMEELRPMLEATLA